MTERNEREQRYSAFYTKLKSFLYYNSSFDVGGVARWGSRTTGNHRNDSDLDVIFWIRRDPQKEIVYPKLISEIKQHLKVHSDIGSDYNVIKIWDTKIKCDLVLLIEDKYRSQINQRRYNE
ncbi:MAG: hypothetical protein ACTSPY_05815 [Candidatus Helarchaeota archaeon]